MKVLRLMLGCLALSLLMLSSKYTKAQCAQCAATVESNSKNGGGAANGLNDGIMYLLAAPYIAVGIVGYVWYKKYKRKNVELNIGGKKLHLN